MLAKVCSGAVSGIGAYGVEVEADTEYGDTIVAIVGGPDIALKKSRKREGGAGAGKIMSGRSTDDDNNDVSVWSLS
jgi:hypothetical protein